MDKIKLTEAQKQKLEQARMVVDQQIDNLLVKIGKSKWSWAIVIGVVVAAWLLGYVQ